MKTTSAVVLALAAAANAVKFTNPSVQPEPGKPFELTWDDAEGPVTITLKSGESGNLKTVEEIASMCSSTPALGAFFLFSSFFLSFFFDSNARVLTDFCSRCHRWLDQGHS